MSTRLQLIKPFPRRYFLWFEFLVLFVLGPLIFALEGFYQYLFVAIWILFFYALIILWRSGYGLRRLFTGWGNIDWLRFISISVAGFVLFVGLVYLIFPERLFAFFTSGRYQLWLAIMLLYPLLSAWPQEVIFRAFYFSRYQNILPKQGAAVLNAVLFSWAHLFYGHWVVFGLTFIGGYIFAQSYLKNRNLAEPFLYHAVLGNLIFTSGLGILFFSGNVG